MKLQSLSLRTSILISAAILTCCYLAPRAAAQSNAQTAAIQAPAVPARITQAIDETQLVRLKGNVHPLARPEFDQGPVADSTPMNRMMLLLQRSPLQEAALQTLLGERQTKDSPNFHNWLTPQQFGAQFGPADADIQTITGWLTRHGFQGIKVAAGRAVIEFSGTAGQVRNAFHTEIHHYLVNGETRQANSSDPQIPAALTPVVGGIVTLHNFPRKSMKRDAGTFVGNKENRAKPLFTTSSGCGPQQNQPCYVVGPADFAKIYNLPPTTTLDGTGVTIALVENSNINPQDVVDFRNLFGLPANFTSANIILDGPDPGMTGSEGEADLDVQIAGMVAPGATINVVVSEDTFTAAGIDLSAIYIIDNNIGSVVSESFGSCEPGLGTTGTQFYGAVWEQAAAQGISAMVSAGDDGSAACDDFTKQATAVNGLAVSAIASTPFDVAVGGTDFDDAGTQTSFWSATNATGTRESALGYIHEIPWNDSCAAAAMPSNVNTVCASPNGIAAGSGGPSAVFAKPPWQAGTPSITPADGARDLPDVSLFASDGPSSDSFYLVCQADGIPAGSPASCVPDPQGQFSFFGAGGTSASSPAFAAIMALINQQQGGRQGNPNPMLYAIAKLETFSSCNSTSMPLTGSATCVFYDVTKNTNSVPCTGGTLNCSSTNANVTGVLVSGTTPAWTAGTGYDTATGLGSVNVTNLAAAWKTMAGAFKTSTTATQVNGLTTPVSISHGTSVTLSATVSGTPTPTGEVSFLTSPAVTVNGGIGCEQPFPATCSQTLSGSGTASFATTFLPGGSYALKAHYSGDATFAPSDDPTGVQVTVTKENSSLLTEMLDLSANVITSYTYGSGATLRIDVLNSKGSSTNCQIFTAVNPSQLAGCAFDATGSATVTDNGTALPESPININSQGHAEDQIIQLSGGTHALVVTYGGDISYNPSPSVNVGPITVSAAATATTLTPFTSPVTTGTSVTLTASIATVSNGKGPTGTVTFFDGGVQIGSPVTVTSSAATSTVPASAVANLANTFTTIGSHSITATYTSGDANYSNSTAAAITVSVTSSGSFTVGGSTATATAGSSGTSTITVTPTGGFTGTVNVTCPTANLPPGVSCTPNPLAINVTGTTAVTGSLTVMVAAPSSTTSASIVSADRKMQWAGLVPLTGGGKGWWGLSAVAGFAAILLLLIPGRKRYRTAFASALVCILSFTLGCGGGYGGGGGTVTTTTKLSVASTKVVTGTSVAFSVTVTSTGRAPTGMVQLYDGTTTVGSPMAVSSGSASISLSGLVVGTHGISAHYLGDTYTTASQSGTLDIAITGSTTLAISASPAASNGNATVNLTIN